jgi:signal transduction histidine kinase
MPESTDGGQATSPGAAGRRLRAVSAATFLVLAGVAVAASVITGQVIRNQEKLILRERTGEAAAVLGSAVSGSQASLRLLGVLARSGGAQARLFAEAARSVTTSRTQGWLVTARRGPSATVIAAAGSGPAVGSVLPAAQERLAQRALSSRGIVTGLLLEGSARWLAFGLGGAAGPGTVVWEETRLSRQTTVHLAASSPFGNLSIAVYTSARPSAASLLIATTRRVPLTGVQYPFRVGADTWLLVAQSPQAVAGALAEAMPWIILAIGVLAAALVTCVVETLGRRRDYAAGLVEERTASLRTAIADLEQAQARLIRQERLAAVGQLASTVGHELRNPLGVVMNVLYLMEAAAGNDPDGPIRRHVATAKREISAATLIVSDLLDYSAGRQPILGPVRIAELVSEALSVAPPPKGVQVVQPGDAELTIDADHDQIRQVLLNLITNGYDAMPGGGTLTISAAGARDSVQITVTDTGSGMDEETREAIFTPFFTRKARGIGLGLAVTKRIVEAHHGTITVQSEPSAGTSFTVTMPAAAALAGAAR